MMTKYFVCLIVCVMVLFQTKRGIASVTEIIRQIVGLDPNITQHLISNVSIRNLEGCSFRCTYKGCHCFVYDNEGHCALYDTFLPSNENTVDGLYALREVVCYPRIFNASYNVALGKPANLSHVAYWYTGADLLTDGDRAPAMPCASTGGAAGTDYPHLIMDLLQIYNINGFYLVNRDNYQYRLRKVRIQVGETLSDLKDVIYYSPAIGNDCTLILPTLARGRYVKLTIDDVASHLTVCEMEVYSAE